MGEIISLIIIGISLSMDTFSLSLSYGTNNLSNNKQFILSFVVGIFHFLMPLLGLFIGKQIFTIFNFNPNFVIGVILILISITMFKEIIFPEKNKILLTFTGIILFAFSVSLDSFTTGIGLYAITKNIFVSCFLFSFLSFSFTYLGLIIGKYATKLLGTYANVMGSILLLIVGFVYLCK